MFRSGWVVHQLSILCFTCEWAWLVEHNRREFAYEHPKVFLKSPLKCLPSMQYNTSACDSWVKQETGLHGTQAETWRSAKSFSREKLISVRQLRQKTTKWEECRTISVAVKVTHLSPWSDQQTAVLGRSDISWFIYIAKDNSVKCWPT